MLKPHFRGRGTLVDMPHTVGPPHLDPRGPQIGPEGPKKSKKCVKLAIFHKITDEGLIFFSAAIFLVPDKV